MKIVEPFTKDLIHPQFWTVFIHSIYLTICIPVWFVDLHVLVSTPSSPRIPSVTQCFSFIRPTYPHGESIVLKKDLGSMVSSSELHLTEGKDECLYLQHRRDELMCFRDFVGKVLINKTLDRDFTKDKSFYRSIQCKRVHVVVLTNLGTTIAIGGDRINSCLRLLCRHRPSYYGTGGFYRRRIRGLGHLYHTMECTVLSKNVYK